MLAHDEVRAIQWVEDRLRLLDQRKLPESTEYLDLESCEAVAKAIAEMVVRGAPAIGITAAYGVALAAKARYTESPSNWKPAIDADLQILANARPTAVNLHWALERMRSLIAIVTSEPYEMLLKEAQRIQAE
ncbi:MAG TPA: S-methyl-5-thioribose-1-phosphate isomerase, partial [Gammaproteobacteria bacterium]|nr:S-methyl-5-thioribose-1-phosphate isomerase [Gammaproteobacteria bacterium]